MLWYTADLAKSTKDHKSLRVNIDFDHAICVKWSPDTKAFIIQKSLENTVEVYKVEKRKDGIITSAKKAITFAKQSDDDVIGLGIAPNGKFIMTCTVTNTLTLYDLRGNILTTTDTVLMRTNSAKISPCSKFIAAAGFSPDCKLWEVHFNKSTGDFQSIKRAFELSGHTSGIYDLAFSSDSSRIVTISKDGTWKIYNIQIEYQKGESPHLLTTGTYEVTNIPPHIAISPNGEVVIVTSYNSLLFYDTATGELDNEIEEIFEGEITECMFDATGRFVFVSGDRHVRVFHNITGYKTEITAAEKKLKSYQTAATKERLQLLIQDNTKFLRKFDY